MADVLSFGFVGCGEIAAKTTKSWLACASARVVRCMDIRKPLADDLAGTFGARASDRLEDVLNDDEVQAVYIPTPHAEHAPLSIRSAEAGKHVLVEKPIACTLTEADEMIDAARRNGVKLGVLLPSRLGSGAVEARRLVRAGAIGDVIAVKLHAISDKPASYWHGGYSGRVQDDWRMPLSSSGGGFLIMNQIHNLDTMVSILDPKPERIYAEYGTFRTPVEVEDFISFVMRLAGGAIVSLDGASAAVGKESFGDRIYGKKGQIALGSPLRVFLQEPWEDIPAGEWVERPAPAGGLDSRAQHVEGFARGVLDGGDVPVPGEEGRRSFEIARGAYLSMQRGRPVTFPVQE